MRGFKVAENSKIEWTTHTFNPWRGCSKVSAGCTNCYAETLSGRNHSTLGVWGPSGTRVVASEAMWREPFRWDRAAGWLEKPNSNGWWDWQVGSQPERLLLTADGSRVASDEELAAVLGARVDDDANYWEGTDTSREYMPGVWKKADKPRVFCASLADVFEDWQGPMHAANGQRLFWPHNAVDSPLWIPDEECGGGELVVTMQHVRDRLFRRLIDRTPNLDWLLLTKRPENIQQMTPAFHPCGKQGCEALHIRQNVWLGISVEDQATANERIPHLLPVPAAVKFLSMEPLLGPVDFKKVPGFNRIGLDLSKFWVIVGGESGHGARPCRVEWIRSVITQCRNAGVPVFVKQLGAFVIDRNDAGFDAMTERFAAGPNAGQPTNPRAWPEPLHVEDDIHGFREEYQGADVRVCLRDRKGGDPAEWPFDLRIRQLGAPER